MDKSQKLKRSALLVFIIFIVLISLSRSDSIIAVTEGEVVKLEFPYPCDRDKVTIRIEDRAPFYTSTDSDLLHLPSYQLNRFSVEEKNCSLLVEINPVKRDDKATYICIAYKDGAILKLIQIRLNVDYPPGKVSCERSVKDAIGGWLLLQCAASVGSLAGEIICYQDAKRLPPYNELIQTAEILTQTIWVTEECPVFCCSSLLDQPKDMCDCQDFVWDPFNTGSVLHPCPSTTPGHRTLTSEYQGKNTEDHSFTHTMTSLSSITNAYKVNISPWLWGFVTVSLLATILLIIALCLCKANKQMKELQQETLTEMNGDNDRSSSSTSQTALIEEHG